MYTIRPYQSSDFDAWNTFVNQAKNGTFLFHRDFMEYHKDRFVDASLLVYKQQQVVAIVPGNKKGSEFFSHGGLTYGGVLLQKSMGIAKVETIFSNILDYLKLNGYTKFWLKSIPVFYHKAPCFELEPLLHRLGAENYCREQNFAIDYSLPLEIHKTKLKHFRKNEHLGFKIKKTTDFNPFWGKVLTPRLLEKHQAKPVHSVVEISLLQQNFPKNIEQYEIWLADELLGGITIFKTETVVKSQYGATTDSGEKYRALDFLFITLINQFKEAGFTYFDMGTVVGNYSLLKQKEELGCHQYLQDFYSLTLN